MGSIHATSSNSRFSCHFDMFAYRVEISGLRGKQLDYTLSYIVDVF